MKKKNLSWFVSLSLSSLFALYFDTKNENLLSGLGLERLGDRLEVALVRVDCFEVFF